MFAQMLFIFHSILFVVHLFALDHYDVVSFNIFNPCWFHKLQTLFKCLMPLYMEYFIDVLTWKCLYQMFFEPDMVLSKQYVYTFYCILFNHCHTKIRVITHIVVETKQVPMIFAVKLA